MLLLRLWNYLRGYVIINVNGNFIEKFINLCANKGIYLWDIKRNKYNNMTLKVSIRGFKSLKGISGKTRCRVTILKRIGIPFIKHRYRKRKAFVVGFIIFVVIIYTLSSFIWVIEINGVKSVSPQQIVDYLAQYRIKPGIIKHRIDKDTIIPNMIINIEGIAWMDIKTIGTKVVVDVVERVPKPEILDKSEPCNIYSNSDGVIKQITAKKGTALVKEGDVVRKWQMLISGIVDNKQNPQEPLFVHSDGEILAATWHQGSAEANLVQTKRERTGQYISGYSLNILSNCYNIINGKTPFKDFDLEEKKMRISLWKNFDLPFELVVKKYYNVVYNQYNISEEEARESAKKDAVEKANKLLPQGVQVVSTNIEYELINDIKTIRATAVLECIENIGYQEKIAKE